MRFEVVLFYLFSFWLMSCSSEKKEFINEDSNKGIIKMSEDKFYYEVTGSASRLCPVEYVYLDFVSESGTMSAVGNSILSAGMGHGYYDVIRSGRPRYYLPKAISALWVSYAERKSYYIDTLIPYDKLLTLFDEDIILKGQELDESAVENKRKYVDKHVRYEQIDLCFLPGGKVVMYVQAPGRNVILDINEVGKVYEGESALRGIFGREECNNIDEYFDIVYSGEYEENKYWLSYIQKKGDPSILIEKYFERFNYTLNLEFEDTSTSIYYVSSWFTNGEYYFFAENYKGIIKTPSRLMQIKAIWDTDEFRYTSWMYFNEEELLHVFDEAYGEDRMQNGELTIKVNKENNQFEISLNVGEKSIKLEKTEIRVFQDPIENPNGNGPLHYKNYSGNHHNLFLDDKGYFQE